METLKMNMTATSTVRIDAPAADVWKALTTPSIIKLYFFGTEAQSDWQVGNPVVFKGEWNGQPYEDKGIIIANEPNRLLRYSYWSSMKGTPDLPENYANISFILTPDGSGTLVTVAQDGVETEKEKKQSEQNWVKVLHNMKDVLEKKA